MCVDADFTKIEKTKRTLYAYKTVRKLSKYQHPMLTYCSFVYSGNRLPQVGAGVRKDPRRFAGKMLEYALQEMSVSRFSESPGIYCFTSREDAYRYAGHCARGTFAVLKVRIPKGARVVRGTIGSSTARKTINAEVVIPIKEV